MLGPNRRPCDTPRAYQPPAARPRDTRWVLPATIFGSSVSYVDESAVNVALPAIQRGLDAEFATMQWVFNGYMLSLASLILLGGLLGDRFGRRRMFIIGLVVFGISSIAAGLAPTAGWLVAARFGQGVGAAILMPVSLAIVGAAYGEGARGRAIGTWAAAGALAIALSRPVGGWLVDVLGWRAVFFFNLPLIGIAILLGMRLAPDRPEHDSEPLDIAGSVLAIVALGLLSFGLITAGGGNEIGAAAAVVAVPALLLFLGVEARAAAPMTPLSMFRNRTFAGANALTFFYYAALSGAFFMLPFLLIDVHGYSGVAAGAAFLPLSVSMAVGSRWSGGLVAKLGARVPLILGSLITLAGYLMLALSSRNPDYLTGLLPGLLLVGAGVTLNVAPLTTAVFDAAPPDRSGAASGINNAIDVTGGLVAVAALGLAIRTPGNISDGSALVDAYTLVMFVAAALAGLSAGIAALMISGRPAPGSVNPEPVGESGQ